MDCLSISDITFWKLFFCSAVIHSSIQTKSLEVPGNWNILLLFMFLTVNSLHSNLLIYCPKITSTNALQNKPEKPMIFFCMAKKICESDIFKQFFAKFLQIHKCHRLTRPCLMITQPGFFMNFPCIILLLGYTDCIDAQLRLYEPRQCLHSVIHIGPPSCFSMWAFSMSKYCKAFLA